MSPYIFIFDGWDEINLAADEGFQRRVDRLFASIRRNLTEQNRNLIRVIITGRPSAAVARSGSLREHTKILVIRPIRPDALRDYVRRLQAALEHPKFSGPDIESWTLGSIERYDPVLSLYEEEFPEVSTLEVLGQPLLAHLAIRVMASLEGDIATVINSPTTLYRYLTDLTCKRGGKAPTIPEAPKHSTKFEGERLRTLLHGVALSINAYGSESIPEEELQLRLESLDIGDLSALEDEEYPLTRLMVSFYFKQAGEHSGCEFLHKSFREYLAAEGIVEVLKEYGRMCQTAPEERPTSGYWRDFDANDPRHWLTRKLGEILSAQWLSTPVMHHLISLLGWDIGRSLTERESAVQQMSGTATKLLPAERWAVIRDALADLWDWWGEGVHLRAQPELKQKIWNLEKPAFVAELCKVATRRVNYNQRTPPPTKRTATIDANLGYGLFQLCAAVHWHVSANAGWTTLAAGAGPGMLWKKLSPGPRRYQATVRIGQSKFVQFAPTGKSRFYFYNYVQRIRGAGAAPFRVVAPRDLSASYHHNW